MNAFDAYAPLTEQVEVPTKLSHKQLLEEFRRFAFNNAGFRAGLLDELSIRSRTGEAMEPDVFPEDHISVTYEFEATRQRYLEGEFAAESDTRPKESKELTFFMSVIATRDAIDMPAYIAQQAYGISDPQAAVDEAGRSAVDHRICFRIATDSRWLSTMESYTFTDSEGDIVSYTSLDSDEAYQFTAEVAGDEEDDDEDEDSQPLTSDELDQLHLTLETLPDQTPVESIEIWEQLQALEESLEGGVELAKTEDAQLAQAYATFQLFKQSLRRQLGLD